MTDWSLVYEGFDPAKEGLREALCTLGNGYFATRGAAPEAEADDIHYPGTYLAGGYNRLRTEIAGRIIENEDLVNMPNWLPLSFCFNGSWFNLMAVEILSYRQELDLRQGILLRTIRFRDKEGREVTLAQRRLVHMGNPHLAVMETVLTAENWSGSLKVRSALDGRVVNAGVARYRGLNDKHLEPLAAKATSEDTLYLKIETNQSEIRVAQAARTQIFMDGKPVALERSAIKEPGYIAQEFPIELQQGRPVTIEKTVSFFTSRDHAISECGLEARKLVVRAGRFDELLHSHALAWRMLWHRFDTQGEFTSPEAGERTARILRLHVFHLLQTVSLHTSELDVGVPARGWHGEAYRGHIFWDELFIFPLLNLRIPEITRALLKYRYRRLNAARANAQQAGYRGAMYPWQSGSNGREESQRLHLNPRSGRWIPDNTRLQYHVNAAIAYNVWQYYQVTQDREFLAHHGAELILEIARFWASLTSYNAALDRYEILGVMGPDEYHDSYPDAEQPGLDNNAYTNVMAVWVLCRALEVLDILTVLRRKELCEMLALSPEELAHWQQISQKMRLVFHDDGIISQFEGYDRLQELDWEGYRRKYGDIQRLDRILEAEGDTTNRYKLSKQADVLMLFYLFSAKELGELLQRLGYTLEPELIPKTVDYYMQRTSHGSTLSRVVHSWVLAHSDGGHSWQLFNEALESDIADVQGGTTSEGIHLGAMAGTVDLIQRGYTGIDTREEMLWLNPCLPSELKWLRMRIQYRGHFLELEMSHAKLKINSRRGETGPIKIRFRDQVHPLQGGEAREFLLKK